MNSTNPKNTKLVLASSSPYRKELLQRLKLDFACHSPDIDESLRENDSVAQSTQRLAREKAAAVVQQHKDTWILASDQLCALKNQVLGKPGSLEGAFSQLQQLSGQTAQFYTAVCLQKNAEILEFLHCTEVVFRQLSAQDIHAYLAKEPAIDCAGSFKSEGLGISLFEAIRSDDPTGLIGLPLIGTAQLLRQAGFQLP